LYIILLDVPKHCNFTFSKLEGFKDKSDDLNRIQNALLAFNDLPSVPSKKDVFFKTCMEMIPMFLGSYTKLKRMNVTKTVTAGLDSMTTICAALIHVYINWKTSLLRGDNAELNEIYTRFRENMIVLTQKKGDIGDVDAQIIYIMFNSIMQAHNQHTWVVGDLTQVQSYLMESVAAANKYKLLRKSTIDTFFPEKCINSKNKSKTVPEQIFFSGYQMVFRKLLIPPRGGLKHYEKFLDLFMIFSRDTVEFLLFTWMDFYENRKDVKTLEDLVKRGLGLELKKDAICERLVHYYLQLGQFKR